MMAFKLSTFLLAITALIGCLVLAQAASTTNGRLLKFYPISRDQYRAILRLAKQQPAISEDGIEESHRSLADWSNTLHTSWTSLFNGTRLTATPSPNKQYPMCVIKTPEAGRRKRGASPLNISQSYAGVAPNVVYPGAPYPYPYPVEDNVEQETEDTEEPDEAEEEVTPKPTEADPSAPIINCIVVVRRKNQPKPSIEYPAESTSTSESYPHHHHHPPYPYPYPVPAYGYPPQVPYPYPYPYPSYHHQPSPSGRSNNVPAIHPSADANYQQMLAEYYKHLQALYMADASTIGVARSDIGNYSYEADDDEDSDESFENDN